MTTPLAVSNTMMMMMLNYLALVLPPLSLTVLPAAGGVAGELPALQVFGTVAQTQLGLVLNRNMSSILSHICLLTDWS